MKNKYYVLYLASYGVTVEYLGEFEKHSPQIHKAAVEITNGDFLYVCSESELRGFAGSIQNVLYKSCAGHLT